MLRRTFDWRRFRRRNADRTSSGGCAAHRSCGADVKVYAGHQNLTPPRTIGNGIADESATGSPMRSSRSAPTSARRADRTGRSGTGRGSSPQCCAARAGRRTWSTSTPSGCRCPPTPRTRRRSSTGPRSTSSSGGADRRAGRHDDHRGRSERRAGAGDLDVRAERASRSSADCPRWPPRSPATPLVHDRQLHIHSAKGSVPAHNPRALEHISTEDISTGQVPLEGLVTEHIPLDRVLDAIQTRRRAKRSSSPSSPDPVFAGRRPQRPRADALSPCTFQAGMTARLRRHVSPMAAGNRCPAPRRRPRETPLGQGAMHA